MEKTDLALVMCPAWGVVQPPVGLGYLKGYLNGAGVRAKCFDLSFDLYKAMPKNQYWDLNHPDDFTDLPLFEKNIVPSLIPFIEQWADRILSHDPGMVGFSLFMSSLNVSIILAQHLKLKRPDLVLIAGGAEVTRFKQVLLDKMTRFAALRSEAFVGGIFDIFVVGEGEETLRELVMLKRQGGDWQKADGIIYRRDGVMVENKPRAMIRDLDALGVPDYSDFEVGRYVRKSLPVVSSRGCVNRCTFCADSPLWKTYRACSALKVVNDLKALVQTYEITEFEFADSLFNGDIRRVEEICDLITGSGLKIQWSAKVAFHPGMGLGLLTKMRAAGCGSLAYGVESGSPRVLSDMRKNMDLDDARRIIRETSLAGIEANCFFLIGYPTETEEDFEMTLDFIRQNARFIHRFDQVTGCHIEENSFLGRNLEKYGIIREDHGWCSPVSTPEIRQGRLQRFRALARELHGHYQCEVQS